jgi:1-acyl-sn-glycerol-3-phosphate acyltransferase
VISQDVVVAWIIEQLARELHMKTSEIDPSRPMAVYGLDSLTAVGLAADLEDRFGLRLPGDLHREELSIREVARLALSTPAPVAREDSHVPPAGIDYRTLDYSRWTGAQRTVQRVAQLVAGAAARIDVEGRAAAATAGPMILASNHLHILDVLWLFSLLPRRTVFLAAEEFRVRPVIGWLLRLGHTIFVARGAGDRRSIDQAVAVLEAGGCVAIAPEGRLSRTGGLIKGQPGVAVLATESGAPVVPVGIFGQERAGREWLRGRRPHVHVRFGEPILIPRGSATARELEVHTDRIMRALARVLPAGYRGQYQDSN